MTVFLKPIWPAPKNVQALTTTRLCDYGAPLQLNDEHVHITHTDAQLQHTFRLPQAPNWLKQVHGTKVITLPSAGKLTEADAAVASQPGIVCAVLTADCLPILLCTKEGTEVAAIHAGWRGLSQGIVEAALGKLKAPASDILAWLGPAISQAAFEVGPEVRAAFLQHSPLHAASFISSQRANHYYADLYEIAQRNLQQSGIAAADIYGGGFCTYSDHRFYSYRRNAGLGPKVNMASLIWFDVN